MPFTLAHPAAVLPLMRRPLDGLALACGAMAPDVPYFVRATRLDVTAQSWYEPFTNATTTHSVAGLPTTLLAALVSYLLARAATRPAMWLTHDRWEATPTGHETAATDRSVSGLRSPRRWAWVSVSLLIGALTHLLWDSLTSRDGLLSSRFEVFNEVAVADVTWTALIGHASSVIGLTAVGFALWTRRRSLSSGEAATRRRVLRAVAGLVTIGLVAGVVSALVELDPSASTSHRDRLENGLSTALTGAGVAVGAVVVVATVGWWLCSIGTAARR